MSTHTIIKTKMAKTPERTGNPSRWGLRLKKAALASYISVFPHIGRTKSGLVLFGAVAVVVPPPLGFVSGLFAAVAYNVTASATQTALRTARRSFGYATREDFDVLAEFNRLQRNPHRYTVPVCRGQVYPGQKTVFPAPEMR